MDDPCESASVIVLNIGGCGRSGSTILSALLGNYEGFFPVGELRGIWRALRTDERCGCGESFSSCEFWRRVGEQAFDGWGRIDLDAMAWADSTFVRHRSIPRALIALRRGSQSDDLTRYCHVLAGLYSAVRDVSGCSVIVDSTKDPPYALLLQSVADLELRFVQLLRDSRGVVYSWNKKGVVLPEYEDSPRSAFMPSPNPWRAALMWVVQNIAYSCVTPTRLRRVVKYESLMSDPAEQLARILQLVHDDGLSLSTATESCEEFVSLPFHTIGGNPVRFMRGRINLQADNEWKTRMPLSQKLTVGAITLPMLTAYGYISVPGRTRHSPGS